jgi:hypothetical protein
MIIDISAGTVRILKGAGKTAGAGFLVTPDGLVVTCAHVVHSPRSKAGEPRPKSVTVEFANGDRREAAVVEEFWRPWDAEDIAVLRVAKPLPPGAVGKRRTISPDSCDHIDPGGRMIAGMGLATNPGVDTSGAEVLGKPFVDQQVINPQPAISFPVLTEVIPEGVDRLVGMQRSDSIHPALIEEALPAGPCFRLQQRVFPPGARIVNVGVGGHDVEVTGEKGRMRAVDERHGMDNEPLKPAQLVIELWAWLRIAVG